MKILRMDHVDIVVEDLAAARAFFVDLGLKVEGEAEMEGEWLDRIIGLKGVKAAIVYLRMPDGSTGLELSKFYTPADEGGTQKPLANSLGIRHIAFVVDDIETIVGNLKQRGVEIFSEVFNYEETYKLCYVRGPEGIILELAEQLK